MCVCVCACARGVTPAAASLDDDLSDADLRALLTLPPSPGPIAQGHFGMRDRAKAVLPFERSDPILVVGLVSSNKRPEPYTPPAEMCPDANRADVCLCKHVCVRVPGALQRQIPADTDASISVCVSLFPFAGARCHAMVPRRSQVSRSKAGMQNGLPRAADFALDHDHLSRRFWLLSLCPSAFIYTLPFVISID